MTNDEIGDYRLFCPGLEDERFHFYAVRIVERIRGMPGPTDFGKGTATAIDEELDRLSNVLSGLSRETREVLIEREIDYIDHDWGKMGLFPDVPIPSEVRQYYRTGVHLSVDDAASKLRRLSIDRYQKRKEDRRHKRLAESAADHWISEGGRITETSGDRTFVAFLETLIEDIGLRVSARTLIQKYL